MLGGCTWQRKPCAFCRLHHYLNRGQIFLLFSGCLHDISDILQHEGSKRFCPFAIRLLCEIYNTLFFNTAQMDSYFHRGPFSAVIGLNGKAVRVNRKVNIKRC